MMQFLLYVALVAAAVFFTGLLFYTFYIVLTSKNTPTYKQENVPGNPPRPDAKQSNITPLPGEKPSKPVNPKKPRRAA